eukprot:scaffold10015_cov87-Skeletonema_marinoi.AAC.1
MYFTKRYKKEGHKKGHHNTNDDDDETIIGNEKIRFLEDHPGSDFAYLTLMPRLKIPVTSIPEGKLCRIEELDINNENPSDVTREKRENYAKMALLMFCPFRELDGNHYPLTTITTNALGQL